MSQVASFADSPKKRGTYVEYQAVSPEKRVDDDFSLPVRDIPLEVMRGEVSFSDFMSKVFMETQHYGGVKLRPPTEWNPLGMKKEEFLSYPSRLDAYKAVYTNLSNQLIRHPIRQEPRGHRGFFSFDLIEQDDITFSQFEKMAAETELKEIAILDARRRRIQRESDFKIEVHLGQPPTHKEFEEDYWKRILHHRPLYGADLSGSLFNQGVTWNLNDLNTILDIVSKDIKGVTSSYLYFGMHRATFAWHIEDMNLPAINYLHFGAGKQWYVIPERSHKDFEMYCQSRLKDNFKKCSEYLRHKTTLVSPMMLRDAGIPVYSTVQEEGEYIVVWPVAYHCGFNTGFNCAEAVNFAFKEWIPFGLKANYCRCTDDSVRIDMQSFLKSYELLLKNEASLNDFKHIRKMKSDGGFMTMEETPAVSRCSKVCDMDFKKRMTPLKPEKQESVPKPNNSSAFQSSLGKITFEQTEPTAKRKRGRPRKNPEQSTSPEQSYVTDEMSNSDITSSVLPADELREKNADHSGEMDVSQEPMDAYEGNDGDDGDNYSDHDDNYDDANDGNYDGNYDGNDDGYSDNDGDADGGDGGDDDDDDDFNNDRDPSFNPRKRKRSESPRKKKKIPRGEMECSIENCTRTGNRSISSLRNTYKYKKNSSGKVCDRHYFSDRRHYMRGTDPNLPTPKKDKPQRVTRNQMMNQQPMMSNIQFSNARPSHPSINAKQKLVKAHPRTLIDQDDPKASAMRLEALKNMKVKVTAPIEIKDETWNVIARGADPSILLSQSIPVNPSFIQGPNAINVHNLPQPPVKNIANQSIPNTAVRSQGSGITQIHPSHFHTFTYIPNQGTAINTFPQRERSGIPSEQAAMQRTLTPQMFQNGK